ncbi:hypothetical protein GJ699_02615 [Duganella sp. FT80W]|uniref:Phage tail tape measure protein n=1 Tax=Duganella guangzhouensis TaxID=2666084 RepID=A0A6I2KTE0_9BURK|nr:hypothetical protein [Duganella guangzhouensis]MRW88871.1 hypothetical protein [Duganella guangzhouensis]
MSFEAYKVAVKLTLVNHVSAGLVSIAGQLHTVHGAAGGAQNALSGVERQMLAIKRAGMIGGAMAGLGFGMLAMMKAPLEEAAKFDQAVGKFKLFGMSEQVNAEAVKFARGMNVIGSSYTENMKLLTEAQGVFRESGIAGPAALEGSKLAAPMLAKINFATESLDEESKAKMRTQSMAMLRFVEMRGGLKDADTFNRIADSGWKAVQSSGGNINWEQMRQFLARGGVAAQGLTDTALFGHMEPIIGELKGSTAGNAWMTAYNRLVGGVKIPNQVAHLLADNGIWDAKRIEWNSQGGIKRFNGNPLKDMETFSTDPTVFYEKQILPMYAKMNHGAGLNAVERARENTLIFGRTGGMMFSLIDRQMETLRHSAEAQAKALGVDKSVDVAKQTVAGKELDLRTRWTNAKQDFGDAVLPLAIRVLDGLTGALKRFSEFAKEHPGTVRALTYAFVGLAAALAFGGVVTLAATGVRGLGLALRVLGATDGGMALVARGARYAGVFLGRLGAIGMAFGVGWTVGTLLYDAAIKGTKFSDWLGGLIARVLSFFGNKEAKEAIEGNKSPGQRTAEAWAKRQQDRADAAYQAGIQKPMLQSLREAAGHQPSAALANTAPRSYSPVLPPAANGTSLVESAVQSSTKSMVPPPQALKVQVISNTHLNGRIIAQEVSEQQARTFARPPTGPSGADTSMALAPVSYAGTF